MFTRTDVATVARLASRAVEGEGTGHTVYAQGTTPRRYVVGGYTPSQMYPTGAASGVVRTRIWDAVHAPAARFAETLGYWEDEGTVYVDLGTTYHDEVSALSVARTRGELAIYDREAGVCIPVVDHTAPDHPRCSVECPAPMMVPVNAA